MAGYSIRVTGDQAALQAFGEMGRRAQAPRPVWDAIGRALAVSTQHRFETLTGPDGTPWPPSIRALLTGGRTMTDTAQLRNSITWEPSDQGVAVGTNLIKAAILQFGGTIQARMAQFLTFMVGGHFVHKREVTIPARPFLGIDHADEAEIAFQWEEYLGAPVGGSSAR